MNSLKKASIFFHTLNFSIKYRRRGEYALYYDDDYSDCKYKFLLDRVYDRGMGHWIFSRKELLDIANETEKLLVLI